MPVGFDENTQLSPRYQDSTEKVWTHAVFIGALPMERLVERTLVAIDPSSKVSEALLNQLNGQGWMAACIVSSNGVPSASDYIIPSYLLGAERLRSKQSLDKLINSVEEEQAAFVSRMMISQLPEAEEEPTEGKQGAVSEESKIQLRPFGWTELEFEITYLFKKLGVDPNLHDYKVIVRSTQYSRRERANSSGIDFLNSFFVQDLDRLLEQADSRVKFGKCLEQYLGPRLEEKQKKNVHANPAAMAKLASPSKITAGRWPESPDRHLTLAQQNAVYTIMDHLKGGGVIGVNGPPGTGKTTLLCDVIADVIVERAKMLAALAEPNQIFSDTQVSVDGQKITSIAPRFGIESGIVVTSSGNNAVKNISQTLPNQEKLGFPFEASEYFKTVSANVAAAQGLEDDDGQPIPVWGLISAVLGNKENRKKFAEGLFNEDASSAAQGGPNYINQILSISKQQWNEHYKNWQSSRDSFKKLLKQFGSEQSKLVEIEAALIELERIDYRLSYLRTEVKKTTHRLGKVMPPLQEADKKLKQANVDLEAIRSHKRALQKPSLWRCIIGWLRYRANLRKDWRDESERLSIEEVNARRLRDAFADHWHPLNKEASALSHQLNAQKKEQEQLSQQREIKLSTISKRDSAIRIPDADYHLLLNNERHKISLWVSSSLEKTRAELFLAALKLHEDTVHVNAARMLHGVEAVAKFLNPPGRRLALDTEQLEAVWGYLFFIVPVVSTALASFANLFAGVKQDRIGWLLVDEAGQATPQSVAGAIWRSKRAVLVGDPLQIRPVVTAPEPIVSRLLEQNEVDERFSPSRESAQTIADHLTSYGAFVETKKGKVWTGMPLRVHRRCSDPMFSIANEISYANQMVQWSNAANIRFSPPVPDSQWFDVIGVPGTSDGQVVPEEMQALASLLQSLTAKWPVLEPCDGRGKPKAAKIFVISPYKKVAAAAHREIQKIGLGGRITSGTTHVFQGQEADIVVFVLGSATGDAGRKSRGWVCGEPNILNVAFTRAKHRVYVIGNQSDWSRHEYFDVILEKLPS